MSAEQLQQLTDMKVAIDTVWVIVAACMVFLMQAGFAMLEVGFSRGKNVGAVVAKILVNLAIGTVAFWAIGFGLAFGNGNDVFGTERILPAANSDCSSRSPSRRAALGEVPVRGRLLHRQPRDRLGHDARPHEVRRLRRVRDRLRGPDLPARRPLDLGRRLPRRHRHAGLRRLDGRPPLRRHRGARGHAPARGAHRQVRRPAARRIRSPATRCRWRSSACSSCGSAGSASTRARRSAAVGARFADIAVTTNLAAAAGVLGAMHRRLLRSAARSTSASPATARSRASSPSRRRAPTSSSGRRCVIGLVAGVLMVSHRRAAMDRVRVDDPIGAIAGHGMGGVWGTLSCGLFTTAALAGTNGVGQAGLFYGGGAAPARRPGARHRRRLRVRVRRQRGGVLRLQEDHRPARRTPSRSSRASTSTSTACGAIRSSSCPATARPALRPGSHPARPGTQRRTGHALPSAAPVEGEGLTHEEDRGLHPPRSARGDPRRALRDRPPEHVGLRRRSGSGRQAGIVEHYRGASEIAVPAAQAAARRSSSPTRTSRRRSRSSSPTPAAARSATARSSSSRSRRRSASARVSDGEGVVAAHDEAAATA